ncbi:MULTISPECIES: lysozyme inhibitor LprI family protein [unclassified Rhizobium]|uniref:lysozyme inhibitor LprI family protein n=1 Tax=unclassified Rhizobium TaxID=2613769 RepID=UPI0038239E6E
MASASNLRVLVALGCGLFSAVCQAQSFDCAKAQTAVEKAICASPPLIAQDTSLAAAYRQATSDLSGDPAKLAELKQQQRRWLSDRNKSCTDSNPAHLTKCLLTIYQARIVELNAPHSLASDNASNPSPSVEPSKSTVKETQVPGGLYRVTSAPAAAPQVSSPRSLPEPLPQPQLASNSFPADQDGSTLMTVAGPGRVAIRAHSSSGVALQLVDMMTGPGERMGAPGVSDGRIDALLDKGTYKIRVFGAKGASGKVELTAEAYQELEQSDAVLTGDTPVNADLGDLQQRSFWIDVPESGRVDVDAVGRSLHDLRLWRQGANIVPLSPTISVFEVKPGLSMTRATLTGTTEPGRYLVTAYGGEKLAWANSDTAQPFHIRTGIPMSLAAGIAEGVIGPFGSVRFEAPADFDRFRLDLPQSAPATLRAGRISGNTYAFRSAAIGKSSREPSATLALPTDAKPGIVEISGYEGQNFRVRGLRFSTQTQFDGSVPNLISMDVAGEGGDEIPATALLVRNDSSGKASVVATDMPLLGPGQAWRQRFNLRGPTSLLFEMAQAGQIGVHTSGVALHADISPILLGNAPRADGKNPERYDLDAGYYLLRLLPKDNASGIVDLTLGTPGLTVPVQPASPARTTVSFGIQEARSATSLELLTNAAPNLLTGPRAVALPADLAGRPLALWQAAGASSPSSDQSDNGGAALQRPASPADLRIDVDAPAGGVISAIDTRNAPIAFAVSNEHADATGRVLTLRFPAVSTARAIAVRWQPDTAAPGKIVRPSAPSVLNAGQKQFLDLAEDAHKSYQLNVGEGGLYRIETFGRLQTSLDLGTSTVPSLGGASDNGDGHNALLLTYLRAGSYQVDVSVQNSSGHLGIGAIQASLAQAAMLVPEGSSRGVLSSASGGIVPIEIAKAGSYQLDLYALGGDLAARLEDADGWPLTAPGPLSTITQDFAPGHYRLVIQPREVDTRFVARLTTIVDPPQLQGHGPHALAFNQAQKFQWREPQGKGDARTPDSWTFDLAADADVSIDLTEGMIGTLIRGDQEQIARFAASPKFSGKLKPGHYRIELSSLAHDDRLDYEITLNTRDLQPGETRFVDLPGVLSFNVEKDRVVSLGTFGRRELKAVLKGSDGTVIERLSGRSDDWNIALSRRLAAGSYTLSLEQAAAASSPSGSSSDDQTTSSDGDQQAEGDDQSNSSNIEVQFALPKELPQPALAANGSVDVTGNSVFTFPLPTEEKDGLALVAAQSTSELVLSVDTLAADGSWKPQAFAHGHTPFIAWPSSGSGTKWRASVWTLDGGSAPIKIGTNSVSRPLGALGDVALEPASIEGLGLTVNVALAQVPAAGLVQLDAAGDLLAGASADRPLTSVTSGLFAPQSDHLWLVSRKDGSVRATPAKLDGEIALTLPAGDQANLPAEAPPQGKVRLWLAQSAFGQPGLNAGRGMGVGANSAVALAGGQDLHLWNAGSDESLQLRLSSIDAAEIEGVTLDGSYAAPIPALSARPVKLPAGAKRLTLDLAPGIAVVAGPSDPEPLNVWSGSTPLSRTVATSANEVRLVNLSNAPASARIGLSPGQTMTLGADQILRRFFGTAGSEAIPVDATKGDILNVSGGNATFVASDSKVLRGQNIALSGPGQLILDHGAGLVALWLERDGNSPWPKPEPKSIDLPHSAVLEGQAMAFRLAPAQPMVLDVSTDAPVIVDLAQNGRHDLQLFPMGAAFHRYVAPGGAVLTLYSTHEGPLSGTADILATPVIPLSDGVGTPTVLAPGATALFGFDVKSKGNIGVGLRSDPDRVIGRLLDAKGQVLGESVNQLKELEPGTYLLEARAPADAPTLVVRPAVVGLSPPPAGPPPEVVNDYLQNAGLKPSGSK